MIKTQQAVPGATTIAAPAATINGDNYLLAWTQSDGSIWWTSCPASNGQKSYDWAKPAQVPGAVSSAGPSLASSNGVVCMAWKGAVSDIYTASLWHGAWSPCVKIPRIGTQAAPALTWCVTPQIPDGLIYLVWLGESDKTIYWSYSANGSTFQPEIAVPHAASTDTPSLANFNGVMYLFWKGESDNTIWSALYEQSAAGNPGWLYPSEFSPASNMLSSAGPAVAYDNSGNLYLVWKGQSDQNIWVSNNTQGEYQGNIAMSPQQKIPVILTDDRPALASQGSNNTDILLAWKGAKSDKVWVGPLQGLRG